MQVTERDISNALKEKHEKTNDIFASQVKIGPAGSKIMDAVAIKKSWSPRTVIGYEIKTSRQDFLKDEKYPVYMENCNIFYFVAPNGVIKKDEIPAEAGLMVYSPDTKKLRTVKKAPYRDIPINPDVLLHIMFWKFNRYLGYRTRAEILEDYKAKKELSSLGREIADKIRRLEFDVEFYKNYYEQYQKDYENLYKKYKELKQSQGLAIKGLSESDIWLLKSNIRNLSRIAEKIEGD